MNAGPYLEELAKRVFDVGLDTVMTGNAAAAINGAPVTTLDVDFMLEQTDENYMKLASLAQQMNYRFVELKLVDDRYMYRLMHRSEPFVIDFVFSPKGISSYSDLKKRSSDVFFGACKLQVASLEDVIASKRATARPKDLATLPILEMTLDEIRKKNS